MSAGPETVEFWETRYREGRTRWDLGGPTPAFVRLLEGPDAPPPGAIAVLGCGRGYDVLLFARHGFHAVGFDFAPSAVEAGQAMAREAGLEERARFELADIFDLLPRYAGAFDYVLERACLCVLAPDQRGRYLALVRDLLKPNGRILAHFFVGEKRDGPPFGMSPPELERLFAPAFVFERQDEPREEGPLPGADMFAILRKR